MSETISKKNNKHAPNQMSKKKNPARILYLKKICRTIINIKMEIVTKAGLETALKMVERTNSSTSLSDYRKRRRMEEVLEVHEMLQQPSSYEDMKRQILINSRID